MHSVVASDLGSDVAWCRCGAGERDGEDGRSSGIVGRQRTLFSIDLLQLIAMGACSIV